MADFFLHTQLIEDLYKKHPEYQHLDVAKIGAQGPDPFYYVLKSAYQKGAMHLADLMHDEKINDLLIAMADYVKAHFSEELLAYYQGFLSHFVMDVNIHPYIYYYTGVFIKDQPETYQYRGYHLKFERSVDIAYIRHRYQKDIHQFHKRSRILPIKETPQMIMDMHQDVASNVYHIDRADLYFANGYQSMRKLLKILIIDRLGIKRFLLGIVDFFHRTSPIRFQDYPYHKKDKRYDYLNLNHTTWHDPISNAPHEKSILEIYQNAFDEADRIIQKTSMYIKGEETIDLKSLFKNRSFNSGYDTSKPRHMIYFKRYDR